jgi:hypothetical protein
MTNPRKRQWATEQVEQHAETDWQRERMKDALMADPTLDALWQASRAADSRQSRSRQRLDATTKTALQTADKATQQALEKLAVHVAAEVKDEIAEPEPDVPSGREQPERPERLQPQTDGQSET